MTTVFIIRNHLGQFLSRHDDWVDGKDRAAVFSARYKDQAVNTLVEINAHDIEQRCRVLAVPLDDKGRPDISAADEPGAPPTPAAPLVLDGDDEVLDDMAADSEAEPGDDAGE